MPPGCLPGHIYPRHTSTMTFQPQNKTALPYLKRQAKRFLEVLYGQGARAGYMAAVDQGIISIANFAATLLLGRNVSPTELGMYGVGFTCLRLARVIQEGITIQPLNTFGAAMERSEFKKYASATSLVQILLALLTAGGVAALGWALLIAGNDTAGPTIFSLWFPFLTWQMQEYLRRMMYTRDKEADAMINSAIANSVRIGLMVYWINQGEITGLSGMEAIAWGSLVALVPGVISTRRYWSRKMDPLHQTLKSNWNFGRWVLGGLFFNWLSVEFYPVITAGLVSFAAAGAYRAIQNLVAPVHVILRATDTFLTPRAAKVYAHTGRRGLSRLLRLTYLFTGIPILGILFVAVIFPEQILNLLYGTTYLEYSNAIILMAGFYLLLYLYWPLQTAFKAIRLSRPIFLANLVATLAMFTLGILAILQWGVYGTLVGQVLNAAIVTVILWSSWIRINPTKLPST